MWTPDTWEVEVLVPLLVVVAFDVLEVLEVLDVPEVLEVVEDVDVWTEGIGFAVYMTHGPSNENSCACRNKKWSNKKKSWLMPFPCRPKMVEQDIGWSALEMTAQPLRALLPFTTKNQQLKLLHSCFTMWTPDTWEVEVLELDVPEVLEVVEDVDVWTKRICDARHMTCLLSKDTHGGWVLLEKPWKHEFMTLRELGRSSS